MVCTGTNNRLTFSHFRSILSGVTHAYTGQLLLEAAMADLAVAVDLIVFRLLSSEASFQAAVNTGHSRSLEQNKLSMLSLVFKILVTTHKPQT